MQHEVREETFSCGQTIEKYKCPKCSYSTPFRICRFTHFPPAPPYRCCQCKTFESHSILTMLKHITECNKVPCKKYSCTHCPYTTAERCKLSLHVKTRHTTPDYIGWSKCNHCKFKTKFPSHLSKHNQIKHSGDPRPRTRQPPPKWHECEQCLFKAKCTRDLRDHVISRHTAPEMIEWLQCAQCPYRGKLKSLLRVHVKLQHSKDIVWSKCEFCEYKAKRKALMTSHVKARHTKKEDLRLLICDQCGFESPFMYKLKRHIKSVHVLGGKPRRRRKQWGGCVE